MLKFLLRELEGIIYGKWYVRNPDSTVKLWRIKASKLSSFTAREYARLQPFPDDCVFYGNNKRELQLQIGNAVPLGFAKRIGGKVQEALEVGDGHGSVGVEDDIISSIK